MSTALDTGLKVAAAIAGAGGLGGIYQAVRQAGKNSEKLDGLSGDIANLSTRLDDHIDRHGLGGWLGRQGPNGLDPATFDRSTPDQVAPARPLTGRRRNGSRPFKPKD
jgi:hypothetical protein